MRQRCLNQWRYAEAGCKIEITRMTKHLSPKGFVLVITRCFQNQGIPIYGNLSGLSVIKCNAANKLHSNICLIMPTHSHSHSHPHRYLCFHQQKHSQSGTFPYQKWYGTASDSFSLESQITKDAFYSGIKMEVHCTLPVVSMLYNEGHKVQFWLWHIIL